MEENLEQKILSWLNTQGYGVEMKVATSLNAAGCEVIQSWFYSDPETGNSREIDVVGQMNDEIGLLKLHSVIECKKSSKPWVLFTSDRATFNRVRSFAIMTDEALGAIINNIQRMIEIDWFRKDGRVAYGITEAFTSKNDETFKAGMTATKAALALLKSEANPSGRNILSFFFPTVVLDGRLFECYLGADGGPVLGEVDSAFLLFPIRLSEYVGASVRIVTLGAFNRYCEEFTSVYHSLRREIAEEIAKLAASLGIKPEVLHDVMKDSRNLD